MEKIDIIMVLPVYNESKRLKETLSYYLGYGIDILVVDNYSSDDTYDIASSFPVRLVRQKNKGTTETVEWLSWLCNYLKHNYIMFLSCSEFLSDSYVSFVKAHFASFDIIYSFRSSYTGPEVSLFLQNPLSLLGLLGNSHDPCCRSVDRCFLSKYVDKVKIHDSFLSLKSYSTYIVLGKSIYNLVHRRPITSSRELHKLVDYSYHQSVVLPNRSLLTLLKRIVYELAVGIALLITFRLSMIQFREILARICLHIMHYVNSTRPVL